MKREIDGFTVGGCNGSPSLPGARLQRLLGTYIKINMSDHTLSVPTKTGTVTAMPGDRIVMYEDGTLEVFKKGE